MYYIIVLQFFIATGYCKINCYTTEPIDEIETCEDDAFCYEASSEDTPNGKCTIIRGCIQEAVHFRTAHFRDNLENNPDLFSVCGTDKCNKSPPDCNPVNPEDLQQNITNLEKNITSLETTVSRKVGEVADANLKVKGVEKQLTESLGEVADANLKVKGLEKQLAESLETNVGRKVGEVAAANLKVKELEKQLADIKGSGGSGSVVLYVVIALMAITIIVLFVAVAYLFKNRKKTAHQIPSDKNTPLNSIKKQKPQTTA